MLAGDLPSGAIWTERQHARRRFLKSLPDTLPGRTETVELWPFSQGEIDGEADHFVDGVFRDGAALSYQSSVSRRDYAERIVRGGFPEAVRRPDNRRREHFFDSYVSDLIARDVSQLSEIERPAQIRALLRLIAARSGQLLVGNALSHAAGISTVTTHRYISLLMKATFGVPVARLLRFLDQAGIRLIRKISSTTLASRLICSAPTPGT